MKPTPFGPTILVTALPSRASRAAPIHLTPVSDPHDLNNGLIGVVSEKDPPIPDSQPPGRPAGPPQTLHLPGLRQGIALDRFGDPPSRRLVGALQVPQRTATERNGDLQRSSSRFTSSRV